MNEQQKKAVKKLQEFLKGEGYVKNMTPAIKLALSKIGFTYQEEWARTRNICSGDIVIVADGDTNEIAVGIHNKTIGCRNGFHAKKIRFYSMDVEKFLQSV